MAPDEHTPRPYLSVEWLSEVAPICSPVVRVSLGTVIFTPESDPGVGAAVSRVGSAGRTARLALDPDSTTNRRRSLDLC